MEPYYSDDLVTLYHGDCREVTAWLDADVLVTDPPYGMAYTDRQGVAIVGDETTSARDEALMAWGDRPALVFGTWKASRPSATRQVLIWDKSGGSGFGSTSLPWGNSHEEVYVLGIWARPTSGGRAREGGTPTISHSVIRCPVQNPQSAERPAHPTPKPVVLMEALIRKTLGLVADPFAGSGSTLFAAKMLGRRAIGVEMEERYCEVAANRLAQDALFGETA